jgi:hypothetical protein
MTGVYAGDSQSVKPNLVALLAQCRDIPVSCPLLICRGAEVSEGRPMREQMIDNAGDLVGRGHDDRFGPESDPHAPVERPQAVQAATERLRCQSKRVAGPVAGLQPIGFSVNPRATASSPVFPFGNGLPAFTRSPVSPLR